MKLFTKEHEWIMQENDGTVYIGISEYATEQLGDIVYIELPDLDDTFSIGDDTADVESIKSTSTIFAPVEGKVIAINEALEDSPEIVNDDPLNEGWLVKLTLLKDIVTTDYMTLEEYNNYVEEL